MLIEWILFAGGVALTVATGAFVATEFALVNLDRAELEARRNRGEGGLGSIIRALRRTATHLSSAQLGITLTTLLTGYLMEPAIALLLRPPLIGLGMAEAAVAAVATAASVLVATLLSMVFGELVPKNFALAVPVATARIVVPFQLGFTWLFRPAVSLLNGTANALLRALGVEPKEEISGARSAEELASLVRRSALAGALEVDTATLLDRTLRFAALDAAAVMTPRPRIVAIQVGDSAEVIIDRARTSGYSRFPVYDENLDDVIGMVHVKRAVAVSREERANVLTAALLSEPVRVPATLPLDGLLTALRERGVHLAVVVDEYGGTAGVVTLEDLVEELVGEVNDEHDRSRAGIIRRGDDVRFPGLLRPDELYDRARIRVPAHDAYETVAGYVVAQLGRMPRMGDKVRTAEGTFVVTRLDGRRIDRLEFIADPLPHAGTLNEEWP